MSVSRRRAAPRLFTVALSLCLGAAACNTAQPERARPAVVAPLPVAVPRVAAVEDDAGTQPVAVRGSPPETAPDLGVAPAGEALTGAALRERCGPVPDMGGGEAELAGAEDFIKRTAHDPSSVEVENCSPPVLTARACWLSTCDVRQNNEFGADTLVLYEFSVGRAGVFAGYAAR